MRKVKEGSTKQPCAVAEQVGTVAEVSFGKKGPQCPPSPQQRYYQLLLENLPYPFRSLPWETNSFGVRVRSLFEGIELDDDATRDDIQQTGANVSFVPDAFCIDQQRKTILLAEIIESNHIDDNKAYKIGEFALDVTELTEGWGVALILYYPREARCVFADRLDSLLFAAIQLEGRSGAYRDALNVLPKHEICSRAVAA
jgi:hypothetical protein